MDEPEINYTLIRNVKEVFTGLLTIDSEDIDQPTAEVMCEMIEYIARVYREYAEVEVGIEKRAKVADYSVEINRDEVRQWIEKELINIQDKERQRFNAAMLLICERLRNDRFDAESDRIMASIEGGTTLDTTNICSTENETRLRSGTK
jgi:hypothetical protein